MPAVLRCAVLWPQSVVKRLEERQGRLVELQSSVLDLWSRCQQDPKFQVCATMT